MACSIRPLGEEDVGRYQDHFARHRAESGCGDRHFMPFAPDDPEGPVAGRALYLDMGFSEVGTHVDRFRIEDEVIDDVIMVLKIR